MQQFDLSLWLQDKSRKVVTRRGNPVRIICTDRKHGEDELPVVFLEEIKCGEMLLACGNDGRSDNYDTPYDLFFADEDELTEFEKVVQNLMDKSKQGVFDPKSEDDVREVSKNLLNIARKELKPEFDREMDKMLAETDKVVYQKGQQDALKSLPKWKKATERKKFVLHVCVMDNHMCPFLDTEVYEGEYYIELDDLRTLPKEE